MIQCEEVDPEIEFIKVRCRKMKVETVQQFYVKEFLEQQFYIEELKLELIDRYTIRVKDSNGDVMDFYWDTESNSVKYKDV